MTRSDFWKAIRASLRRGRARARREKLRTVQFPWFGIWLYLTIGAGLAISAGQDLKRCGERLGTDRFVIISIDWLPMVSAAYFTLGTTNIPSATCQGRTK